MSTALPPGDTGTRILVVEDDATVAEVVSTYLRRAGHEVETVTDGVTALARAAAQPPDLVVLDLMLPGLDGLEVCRRLRQRGPVPVIMLTALGEESDRLLGLEIGADDYVTKPFSPRELVLRVASVLRRSRGQPVGLPRTHLRDGALVLDTPAHEARLDGEVLPLTAREFDLLAFFLAHPRQSFNREQLLEHVWGWSFGDQSTVTVHVRRLREKIETDPARPRRIATVWGVGYRYEPVADGPEPADSAAPPAGIERTSVEGHPVASTSVASTSVASTSDAGTSVASTSVDSTDTEDAG